MNRGTDIVLRPLEQYVSVYHSGQSDVPGSGSVDLVHGKKSQICFSDQETLDFVGERDRHLSDVRCVSGQLKSTSSFKVHVATEDRTFLPSDRTRSNVDVPGFDVSITAKSMKERSLPVGVAHPCPRVSEVTGMKFSAGDTGVKGPDIFAKESSGFNYHRKTREVDYWIGRHSERHSRGSSDLTADVGVDVLSDFDWDVSDTSSRLHSDSARFISSHQEMYDKTTTRRTSPAPDLHWTTVSETTSVSYKKRISIERSRPRTASPSRLPISRRRYRPPPPPPEVAAYVRRDWTQFENSSLPRKYAGVPIEDDLRNQHTRFEATSLPSTYFPSTDRKAEGTLIRYDLPHPSSPPHYNYLSGERNNWTVEGGPKQPRVVDQSGQPLFDRQFSEQSQQATLQYQKSNLEEIPIVSRIRDLPMIEDGAVEYPFSTVIPVSKIETQDLTPGEHLRTTRSAPLRRARQRIHFLLPAVLVILNCGYV
ncbi:unnamed protein product [Thelazia callipaeda]|uniref:Junctophilin-2 n=1 Tax=Thelazia callipaeda TaxID=103827 RepID=A0A0N5CRH3_THECL|nr:unnamed protein product [Thelazia callipaeda]